MAVALGEAVTRLVLLVLLAQTPTPQPSPVQPGASDPIQMVGALVAIALALAAGILGYRIIRGGRGL